ncbi:MAG: 4-alpha-glucanotransferase [Leptospiraceae bacterium]|nr:4-alpha-glucanotransferase [Leptospiraceae bacterium]
MEAQSERKAGLLLHTSSFPDAEDIIGNPGPGGRRLLDFMQSASLKVLQVLPMGPIGAGNSPYASFSAFALEPLFLSLADLERDGYVSADQRAAFLEQLTNANRVDFGILFQFKRRLLLENLHGEQLSSAQSVESYSEFCFEEHHWLHDYALFMALRYHYQEKPWFEWPTEHRDRRLIQGIPAFLQQSYEQQCFLQWLMHTQWSSFRNAANQRGIEIMGDCPIFVSHDSADVWAHPELFMLNEHLELDFVAGVPPDYFSETGQRWGNPLYDWPVHQQQGYDWWSRRLARQADLFDSLRIDHFRGFDEYWAIPASSPDARQGSWQPGPGKAFFDAMQEQAGMPLIIAEDLGIITDTVRELLGSTGLPGMRVFEFAPWSEGGFHRTQQWHSILEHDYIPESWPRNCIGYAGTHDNNTFQGWYDEMQPLERYHFFKYLGMLDSRLQQVAARIAGLENQFDALQRMLPVESGNLIIEQGVQRSEVLLQEAYQTRDQILDQTEWPAKAPFEECMQRILESESMLVIIAMQDVLGLGANERMNTPGTSGDHNWSWRLDPDIILDATLADKISRWIASSHR